MWFTTRKSNNEAFFIGNRSSIWYVVAYGMIGASLSGVTFISVPGWVGDTKFSYMMMVFGFFVGYLFITTVLMPVYYKLKLTSIYTYLDKRLGRSSYKTGALFFLISRIIGASFRMFIVVNVLQIFVFDSWGIPFWATVTIFMIIIILYTLKGGIKTIVWTDSLQTTFMLIAVVLSIILIGREMNMNFSDLVSSVSDKGYSKIFFSDWNDKRFFLKQFLSGVFISIVMTGLDQDMMQKNLSCRNINDAKKNMFWFSIVLIIINFIFLFLGAVLFIFAKQKGIEIPLKTDNLFPIIVLKYLGPFAGVVFIIGLISAAYSSADSALTALTTSFCIDFLGFKEKKYLTEKNKEKTRYIVHLCFAALLLLVITGFEKINNKAVIDELYTVAGYTYGPLLGLFSFGLFTKFNVKDKFVPVVCILSPVICYFLNVNSENLFNGYKFGFELLILNGIITFLGLFLFRKKNKLL
jgi:Na+/proline symporter